MPPGSRQNSMCNLWRPESPLVCHEVEHRLAAGRTTQIKRLLPVFYRRNRTGSFSHRLHPERGCALARRLEDGRKYRYCVAPRASEILRRALRQNNPTGKSLRIFRSSSQARESKIFRLTCRANHHYKLAPSHPNEGRVAIVTNVAMGCGGRRTCDGRARARRTAKLCGPGAPMLASSSREAKLPAGDGGKKARSPGRARSKL